MNDIQPIIIVGGLVINAIAVFWNIYKTSVLHKQTSDLQQSNANLQSEVNRLTLHLNQEIIRLNRILELTRGMYLSATGFGHKLAMAKWIQDGIDRSVSPDEHVNFFITVDGSIVELRAIVNAIGDSDLQNLVEDLVHSVPSLDIEKEAEAWFKNVVQFGRLTTNVQEKVYRLLQKATDTSTD